MYSKPTESYSALGQPFRTGFSLAPKWPFLRPLIMSITLSFSRAMNYVYVQKFRSGYKRMTFSYFGLIEALAARLNLICL